MVTIKQRLDNDDHYTGGNTKEYLVIHDTGNATDSDEGNANYFCTGSRGASAHYFVDDNSITQVVKDEDCSWHCGDGGNKYGIRNRNSIGIEQCRVNGVVTEKTMQNTLDLVVMLMKKYGIPEEKVVRHYDASRKNCPASFNLDGKWTRWFDFKAKLHAKLNPSVGTYKAVAGDTLWGISKKFNLSVAELKSINGLTSDLVTIGQEFKTSKPAPTPKPVAPTPTPTYPSDLPLYVGSRGNNVKKVQRFLGITADGIFRGGTKIAVINYQKMRGITPVDGIVGKITWGNMFLGLK